ncbi:MAG: 50S ribosomal protein L7/L12 [Metamycoplasmataceae bacterium]
MSKITKESFIESLKTMTIQEVMELVNAMKEEFGIDPSAVAVAAGPAAVVEEKTAFTVTLKSDGGKKVNVIKVVKDLTGLGLMEAKALVESAPCAIKENIKKEEAAEIEAKLKEAGAEVVVS